LRLGLREGSQLENEDKYLTSAKLEGKSTIRAPPKRGVDV
jgi:hypothetical protein